MTFSASVDSGSADVVGDVLTVTPGQDFNGDLTVTVLANDGELSGSGSFVLTVTPVNDAPVVDAVDTQTVAEDTDFTMALSATDVDGDDVTFSASLDGNGSASVDGSTLTVSPAADYNGDITVTVSASDGTLAGNSNFTLTVTPVNDAPTAIPVIPFSEVGISKTLSSPNSLCRFSVVPNTPFGSVTPSP